MTVSASTSRKTFVADHLRAGSDRWAPRVRLERGCGSNSSSSESESDAKIAAERVARKASSSISMFAKEEATATSCSLQQQQTFAEVGLSSQSLISSTRRFVIDSATTGSCANEQHNEKREEAPKATTSQHQQQQQQPPPTMMSKLPSTTTTNYQSISGNCRRGNTTTTSTIMIPLILVLLAASCAITQQTNNSSNTASGRDGIQNWSTDQRNNEPLGELLAIGAISPAFQDNRPGRLIDRIEVNLTQNESSAQVNKLQYIIEFMRQNKLSKFCDLLTSERPEIRRLNEKLNSLDKFTLFVPTDEALLLMPNNQMELIRGSASETKQFLLAHATSELVTPSSINSAAGTNQLHFSLSGIPMRITTTRASGGQLTAAQTTPRANQTGDVLIVNGASTLAGQSYALQEQSNTSATYAIVHLIDRSLYPATSIQRLLDLMRSVAPSMANYLERDPDFLDELASAGSKRLITVLAPSEAALKQVHGSKLDARLETNQTFLREFLRGHLIEGLHYTAQLDSPPNKLKSLSGSELEFETRRLQSRIVLLVNSVPIVEPDLVASNGVIHLLAQPLVGRHLLDDCHCGQAKQKEQQATTTQSPSETVAAAYDRLWSSASGPLNNKPIRWNGGDSNELEREESRLETPSPPGSSSTSSSQRIRAQRSGLVARNNRDFYRPSAAPANLLAPQQLQPLEPNKGVSINEPPISLKLPPKVTIEQTIKNEQPGVSFDVDRAYKVVLDASARQKMRENIRISSNLQQTQLFTYDKPMSSNVVEQQNATRQDANNLQQMQQSQRPYSDLINATGVPPTNGRGWTNIEQLSQVATSRQQRLLKFQLEDARHPGLLNDTAYQLTEPVKSPENQVAAKLFADQQNSMATKTSVAPPGFMGCAFYDAECKRLVGRLVRLPVIRSRQQQSQKSFQQDQGLPPVTSRPHLDSTFGETTESPALRQPTTTRIPVTFNPRLEQSNRLQSGRLTTVNRMSPLNQPLPPWNDEAAQLANWRAQDKDIARITNNGQQDYAPGFTGGIGRQQLPNKTLANQQQLQSNRQPQAEQIFLTPVKVIQLQEAKLPANLTNGAMFVAPSPIMRQQPASQLPKRVSFAGSRAQQFHTPTPYSVSIMTTHMPSMFSPQQSNNIQFGRLINSTEIKQQPPVVMRNQPLKSPVALRKERPVASAARLQEELNKIHQQQQQQVIFTPVQITEDFTGDFSITSAKLSSNNNGSLQSLASNQSPNVSANFVRSVPSATGNQQIIQQVPTSAEQQHQQLINDQNVEYFQDRSIADIMDDSGLRIDGQQVTFSRLKECLVEAGLLSLTTQTGSSSLTIFMPTDAAFQRLVQQQAAMQQLLSQPQQSTRGRSSFQSNRLTTKFTDGRIPLVVRAPQTALSSRLTAGATSIGASGNPNSSQDASISAAVDRLTLDCRTEQVRQLLLDHLSARMVTPKQLQTDLAISSLSGRQLLLSSVPSKKIVIVDGQPVIAATRAKNGMVYVVNKFLNLTQQVPNVVDLMMTQPNLTTFLSYLTFSKLTDRVKREFGPITILAPTNEAFEQLSTNARQLINSDPAALADVLRGHIVEGAQFGKLISMRNQLKTMNPDQTIEAKVIKPNVYLLDNQMTSMRLVGTAGNGVINTIDRLIVPAWLRNSMSANGRTLPGTSAESSANQPSVFTGELDSSVVAATASSNADGQQNQRATMNLPLLNGRPTQFEQRLPGTRASSNSFLLAGANDQLSQTNHQRLPNTENNNSLNNDDFVVGSPTVENSNNGNSPFLRVAANLTGGLVPKQRRTGNEPPAPTSITSSHQQFTTPDAASNRTVISRNMQLIEKLSNLMQAHKFVKFLAGSKLAQLLKPGMNYVILVPSDEAVDKLPMQILDMLEREPERLADLAHYHVLETTFEFINNIPEGQTLNSINDKEVIFNWHRNNSVLTASGAIIKGGIQEENIALLLVDRVLYPTPGDILNIVTKSPILSNFTSLLQSTGLQSQLSLSGPFTLFAPSDFAFMRMDKRDLEFMQRNRETARRFLLRHMSQPVVFTSSIELSNSTSRPMISNQPVQNNLSAAKLQQQAVPTLTINNMLGEDLTLRKVDDFFSVNDINISYADVAATNGIVHVIDGIL